MPYYKRTALSSAVLSATCSSNTSSCAAEQRKIRAQSESFVSAGVVNAEIRWTTDGGQSTHSAVFALPTAGADLEAHAGKA